ncbi:MAG: hypothetical protein R3C32_08230 [Chloroflexota bacterium]
MTSKTSAIAVDIASDKALTNQLLASAGMPVPRSETVDDVEGAVRAANRIGFPVVVKPLDGNHGRGVPRPALGRGRAQGVPRGEPRRAGAATWWRLIVHGADHRVLVIGGRMVAVAERVPAGVTGDGEHTVEELVAIENADPRRGYGHEKVLTRITVDQGHGTRGRAGLVDGVDPACGHLGSSSRSRATCPRAARPSTGPWMRIRRTRETAGGRGAHGGA